MQSSVSSLPPNHVASSPGEDVTRVLLKDAPYLDRPGSWLERGVWPCRWIRCAEDRPLPWVAAYRKTFSLDQPETIRVHVAADERYELFLDGRPVGRGGERGDPCHWFFDTYDLRLAAGAHTLVARVWTLGRFAPRARMSLMPGFLLSPDRDRWIDLLGTGVAPWEGKLLGGHAFDPPFSHPFYSIGHNTTITALPGDLGWRSGEGGGWRPVRRLHFGSDAGERTRVGGEHLLVPATLPAPLARLRRAGRVRHATGRAPASALRKPGPASAKWTGLPYRDAEHDAGLARAWSRLWKDDVPLVVPPRSLLRVLIDFEDYLCAWPSVEMAGSGCAEVGLFWAESLFHEAVDSTGCEGRVEAMEKAKGRRDLIEGKFFQGVGDRFRLPGGEEALRNPVPVRFDTPFWRAGRYLEITVETDGHPVELRRLELSETRYPLEAEGRFDCGDPRVARLIERATRTFEASCHDAYVDPYYEQMMWAGDGLQNILMNFTMYRDARLARKWLELLHASRLPSGLTRARHPAKDCLLIAPYALYWVQGLKEYAWWRDDETFVRGLLPATREILQTFERFMDSETGCLLAPPGWNFVDWVPGWSSGMPPPAGRGLAGSIIDWHWIVALMQAAELEESLGEPEMAERHRRVARRAASATRAAYWREKRGLFADDLAGTSFSEHAQALAIISGLLDPATETRLGEALLSARDGGLHRATISFSHYLFEAYRLLGRTDRLFERLDLWFGLDDLGLLTLPEGPEPSRSDCHSWGAHPVYHFHASLLGIRPAGPGFRRVRIVPCLGPLERARARLVHPEGVVEVDMAHAGAGRRLRGTVTLPRGITGTLVFGEAELALEGGVNLIDLPPAGTMPAEG
ncbi:glycogen debranching enzyme [Opitutaceae bacterium TAV1]|nr:glycogen debranching enzyme [Opitutaceae bacterium TAV1]